MEKEFKPLLLTDDPRLADRLRHRLEEERLPYSFLPLAVLSLRSDLTELLPEDVDLIFLHLTPRADADWHYLTGIREQVPAVPLLAVLPQAGGNQAAQMLEYDVDDYLLADEIDGPALPRAIRHAYERQQLKQELSAAQRLAQVQEANARATSGERLPLSVANQVTSAIENARLFEETDRRAQELASLVDISAAVRVAEGRAEIMEIVLDAGLAMCRSTHGAIAIPDDTGQQLVIAHQKNWPETLRALSFPLQGSVFGHVFTTGEPFLASNLREEPIIQRGDGQATDRRATAPGAAIYAPLLAGKRVIGVIALTHHEVGAFDVQELRLLTALAEIAGSALDRAALMETLEQRVAERTRELAAANERLQELDRLKSKFVSDVSHELRTPITNLSLYMDLLEHGKAERSERYWSVLRKQAERLNQLIEDILSLSRLELGRWQGEFTCLDLNRLLAEMLPEYEPEVVAAGLTLSFEPVAVLPPIRGQREQLQSVVANLLDNAINYTPTGEVRVSTGLDGEEVFLSVADTGAGIAPEDLPHIFERFYRGRYAGQSNIPGTGLGLAIVQEVTDLHGGRIKIESEEGKGTCVRIWLPQAESG